MDILDEVKKDLQEERLQNLFFKYGKFFIVFIFVFLISGIGYFAYCSYQEDKFYEQGSDYMLAMLKVQSNSLDESIKKLEVLSKNESSYGAIAMLNLAAFKAMNGKLEDSIAIYKKIAESDVDKIFKEYARLMQISSMYAFNNSIDEKQRAEIIKQLEEYISTSGAFKANAQEQLAALYLDEKKFKEANQLLTAIITNPNVPVKLQMRAEQMLILTSN